MRVEHGARGTDPIIGAKPVKVSFACRPHPIARRREDKQGPREAIRTQKWFRSGKKTTLMISREAQSCVGVRGEKLEKQGSWTLHGTAAQPLDEQTTEKPMVKK